MALNLVKKLSISTLMLASAFIPIGLNSDSVFADTNQFDIPARASNSDGTPAWSVNEMIAINHKLESEREAKCGRDAVCRDQLYAEQQSRPGVGHALLGYNNKYFLITAVYPEQNKIKVVFHGDDQWLKAIGFNYGTPIEELIISWFDEGIKAYNNGEWADAIAMGDPWDSSHVLYAKNIYGGFGWEEEPIEYEEFSFPTDEEFEITTENPEDFLINNTTRKIHFRAFGYARNNIINNADYYDYGACYNSPDYSPEVGCHLFYDERYHFFYLPYEILPTDDYYTYVNTDSIAGNGDTTGSSTDNNGSATTTGDDGSSSATDDNGAGSSAGGSDTSTTDEPGADNSGASGSSVAAGDTVVNSNTNTNTDIDTDTNTDTSNANDSKASTLSTSEKASIVNIKTESITPNTGEATNTENHSAVEFPWWLGAVFVLGAVALGWLFWPNRKNSLKKSKK